MFVQCISVKQVWASACVYELVHLSHCLKNIQRMRQGVMGELELVASVGSCVAQSCMSVSWKSYIIVPVGGTRRDQTSATDSKAGSTQTLCSWPVHSFCKQRKWANQIIGLSLRWPVEAVQLHDTSVSYCSWSPGGPADVRLCTNKGHGWAEKKIKVTVKSEWSV